MKKNTKKIKLFAISSIFITTSLGLLSLISTQNNNEIIENPIIVNENTQNRGTDGYPTTGNVPGNFQDKNTSWWWYKYIPQSYISESELASIFFSSGIADPESFIKSSYFDKGTSDVRRTLSKTEARKYALKVYPFEAKSKTPNTNTGNWNKTNEFYGNFYMKLTGYSQQDGWVTVDLINSTQYSEHWWNNRDGRLTYSNKQFVYKSFKVNSLKWDADNDGKLESKDTNSKLKITPKSGVDISTILPSEINENNYSNYLDLELLDFPKNAFLKNIILVPKDKEKKLEIFSNFSSIFEKGRIVSQGDNIDKYKIVIEGFSVDDDGDGKPDSGNSEWNPKIKTIEAIKRILPSQLSTDPKSDSFIGKFIDLNEVNIVKGTNYSYVIDNPRDNEGTISVVIYVDKYFENGRIVNQRKTITPPLWQLSFGKDVDGDKEADFGDSTYEINFNGLSAVLPSWVLANKENSDNNNLVWIGDLLNIKTLNEYKDAKYTYTISNQNNDEGSLNLIISVSHHFKNGELIKNHIIFNSKISDFGQDKDNDGKIDGLINTIMFIKTLEKAKELLPSKIISGEINEDNIKRTLFVNLFNDVKNEPVVYKYEFSDGDDENGALRIKVTASIAFINDEKKNDIVIFNELVLGFGKDIDKDGRVDLGNSTYKITIKEEGKNVLPSDLSNISNSSHFIQKYLNIESNNSFKNASFRFNIGNLNNEEGSLSLQVIVDKTFINGNVFSDIEIFNQKIFGFGKDIDGDKNIDKGTTIISEFDLNKDEMKKVIVNLISTVNGNNYIENLINPKVENGFKGFKLNYQIIKKDNKNGIIWIKITANKAFVNGEVKNEYQLNGPEQDGLFKIEGFGLDFDENDVLDKGTTVYDIKTNELISNTILPSSLNETNVSNFLLISGENIFKNSKLTFAILAANDLEGTIKLEITIDQSFLNGNVILDKKIIVDLKGFGKDADVDGNVDIGSTTFSFRWDNNKTKTILPSQINFIDEKNPNYYTNFLSIESYNSFKNAKYEFATSSISDNTGSLLLRIWASSSFENGIEVNRKLIYNEVINLFGKDVDGNGKIDSGTTKITISPKKDKLKTILPSELKKFSENDSRFEEYFDVNIENGFSGAKYKFDIVNVNDILGEIYLVVTFDKYFENGEFKTNYNVFSGLIKGLGVDVDSNGIIDSVGTEIIIVKKNIDFSHILASKITIENIKEAFSITIKNPVINFNENQVKILIDSYDNLSGTVTGKIYLEQYWDKITNEVKTQNSSSLIFFEKFTLNNLGFDKDGDNLVDNKKTTKIDSKITFTFTSSELNEFNGKLANEILNNEDDKSILISKLLSDKYLLSKILNPFNPVNENIVFDEPIADNLKGTISINLTLKKSFSNGDVLENTVKSLITINGFPKTKSLSFIDKINVNEEIVGDKKFKIYTLDKNDFNDQFSIYSFEHNKTSLIEFIFRSMNKLFLNDNDSIIVSNNFKKTSIEINDFDKEAIKIYDNYLYLSFSIFNVFDSKGIEITKENPLKLNLKLEKFESISSRLTRTENISMTFSNSDYNWEFLSKPENNKILKQEVENNFWNIFSNSKLYLENNLNVAKNNLIIPNFSAEIIGENIIVQIDEDFEIFEYQNRKWELKLYSAGSEINTYINQKNVFTPQDLMPIIILSSAGGGVGLILLILLPLIIIRSKKIRKYNEENQLLIDSSMNLHRLDNIERAPNYLENKNSNIFNEVEQEPIYYSEIENEDNIDLQNTNVFENEIENNYDYSEESDDEEN
ncbi:MAG: lipoprotein 17-related variable surface protein [Metamycoplasmataceae bacterium]